MTDCGCYDFGTELDCYKQALNYIRKHLTFEPNNACAVLAYVQANFKCYTPEIVTPTTPITFPPLTLPIPIEGGNNTLPGSDDYDEDQRKPIWWYHTDHLGSSTYLTDNFGRPSHYYETLPFGEMMVEHNQSANNPTNNGYDNKFKFNGKELDDATQMYYYGARYYDPRISIFVSVDPLAEETMTPYQYVHNNPIRYTDPTGMSAVEGESIGVKKIGEGKYEVVSGTADGDKGIYLVDSNGNYNKNSEKIGESLTEYSFLTEEGKAVKGAVINTYDTSGIEFLNNEVINNSSLTQTDYIPNAFGGKHYDFKARGRNKLPKTEWNKHHYRGMLFQGVDNISESNSGKTTFASARDIGNVGAGYFAASKGWNWSDTRSAFDGLQKWQELNPFAVEGKPSQNAQKVGHTAGYRIWGQKNPMQYRNRQRNGLN